MVAKGFTVRSSPLYPTVTKEELYHFSKNYNWRKSKNIFSSCIFTYIYIKIIKKKKREKGNSG